MDLSRLSRQRQICWKTLKEFFSRGQDAGVKENTQSRMSWPVLADLDQQFCLKFFALIRFWKVLILMLQVRHMINSYYEINVKWKGKEEKPRLDINDNILL